MSGLAAEIRSLTFAVHTSGGRRTIADVATLDLAAGEMVALSGPSGCGKSTLLYLLAGLLVPQQGTVRWDGIAISALKEAARDRWRREHAGFVFQSFNLVDELSPVDNVLLPAWFVGHRTTALRQKAEQLLASLGVPADRQRASLLSRGEQQRVALARALLPEPKVIFADEPTASLDERSGLFVAETLGDLASQGKTVLVASHDPVVLQRAGRVIHLDHGRIVARREPVAA